jgi:glycosyltransferase involved in cell wall biosynthesis
VNFWPRVLQLVPTMQRRGIERVVTDIATGLHGNGFVIDVCCQRSEGPLARLLAQRGVEVSCLGEKGPRDIRAAIRLWKIIKENRYDILHWHCPTAVGYQIPVAIAAGVPRIICTFHGLPGVTVPPAAVVKQAATRICTRILSGRVSWLYGCSQAVLDSQLATGWSRHRSSVINNGVDLSITANNWQRSTAKERLGLPSGGILIGCVGALSEEKGQRYLIEALPLVRKVVPSACVVFVGAGPSLFDLKNRANKCGCEDAVFFIGEIDDVSLALSAMDVFAFPSIAEGLGLALIEAMACGIPVVASAVGGVPEVVSDGEDGVLVPPRDPGALADAILRVSMNRAFAESIRTRALKTVSARFTIGKMIKKVSDLYCTVSHSSL